MNLFPSFHHFASALLSLSSLHLVKRLLSKRITLSLVHRMMEGGRVTSRLSLESWRCFTDCPWRFRGVLQVVPRELGVFYSLSLEAEGQSFKMTHTCGHVTAQSFAEFAQNLYMCTTKLERSSIFTIFTYFCHVFSPFV